MLFDAPEAPSVLSVDFTDKAVVNLDFLLLVAIRGFHCLMYQDLVNEDVQQFGVQPRRAHDTRSSCIEVRPSYEGILRASAHFTTMLPV